jgi:simple sugar transport system permease protein
MTANNESLVMKIRTFFFENIVMLVFLAFVVFGFIVSDTFTASSFVNDIMSRFFRNGVLILALIIPVMAGLGLNFGIVVGALAGMLAVIFVRYNFAIYITIGDEYWYVFSGMWGLMFCFILATPIAIFFGYLTGKLYNKTRGQEMIASLIVSFFAEGLYMIVVLFVVGGIIPVTWGHGMVNPAPEGARPIGIRGSFEMGLPAEEMTGRGAATDIPGMTRALNNLWRMEFVYALVLLALAIFLFLIIRRIYMRRNPALAIVNEPLWAFWVKIGVCGAVLAFALYSSQQIYYWYNVLQNTPDINRLDHLPGITNFVIEISNIDRVPMVAGIVIGAVGLFIVYFSKTKLGQDCRSVGQSQQIANVSGINVDRTRIIATIMSTVLAAWGMIIFLQDIGHVSTYTVHRNIGFFSVAAILVGGATAAKASVKNAMVGLVLFHGMFIVSPAVGLFIFNDGNTGEYMRTFMVYGVIGLSLGLYVWKGLKAARDKERLSAFVTTESTTDTDNVDTEE